MHPCRPVRRRRPADGRPLVRGFGALQPCPREKGRKGRAPDGMTMEPREKDFWDKAAVVLQPVGGLLAALAVAGLGFFGSQFIERRQAEETRARFASELI